MIVLLHKYTNAVIYHAEDVFSIRDSIFCQSLYVFLREINFFIYGIRKEKRG